MNCSEENEKGDRATYVYVFFSIAVHTIALCCMLPMAHYSMMGTPVRKQLKRKQNSSNTSATFNNTEVSHILFRSLFYRLTKNLENH